MWIPFITLIYMLKHLRIRYCIGNLDLKFIVDYFNQEIVSSPIFMKKHIVYNYITCTQQSCYNFNTLQIILNYYQPNYYKIQTVSY